MLTDEQKAMLEAPLDDGVVKQRKQAGVTVSYVEGHYCIRRANAIFGYGNWRRETLRNELISVEDDIEQRLKDGQPTGKIGWRVAYLAQVRVHVLVGEWVSTDGTGFGESTSYISPGQAHESAAKEAETDAMKRAMICFGDQFGLGLYGGGRQSASGDNGRQRQSTGSGNGSSEQGGSCPKCGKTMEKRYSKKNDSHFWGCPGYPECKCTFDVGKAPWEQQAAPAPPPVDGGQNLHAVTDFASYNRALEGSGVTERARKSGLYEAACSKLWGGPPQNKATLSPDHWQELWDETYEQIIAEAEKEAQSA